MPRSFLIKKMTDKFTREAAHESKKGQMNDLGGKCVSNIAGGTKPESVQETSRLQLWNGLGTPYIYPAEVTSNYTQVLSGNSSPQRETELKTEDYIDEESENVSNDFPEKRSSGSARVKHKCIECHRSFSTVSGLHKHKQFHCPSPHSRKEFTCKYCDKIYVSLGALKMHIRTHTLPCQCKICGKAFSRPWLLQGHIRTHTGEKPYQCPNCQRAFADRSNLRAHLQTHSTVKKYSCSECSRSFSRMSLLLKHQYSCGTGSDLS